MRVIAHSALRDFWESRGHDSEQAMSALSAWEKTVEQVDWSTPNDVIQTFNTADPVGNCTVFNVGGNKYRVITRIMFRARRVYILAVLTHAQYDKKKWVEDCGCHEPPPSKK